MEHGTPGIEVVGRVIDDHDAPVAQVRLGVKLNGVDQGVEVVSDNAGRVRTVLGSHSGIDRGATVQFEVKREEPWGQLGSEAGRVTEVPTAIVEVPAVRVRRLLLTVRGRVLDAVSRMPIVGACVRIKQGPLREALTDVAGDFRVLVDHGCECMLFEVECDGYESIGLRALPDGEAAPQVWTCHDLRMLRGFRTLVRVCDSSGVAIPEASVSLPRFPLWRGTAATDGRVKLPGLRAGDQFSVMAWAPGFLKGRIVVTQTDAEGQEQTIRLERALEVELAVSVAGRREPATGRVVVRDGSAFETYAIGENGKTTVRVSSGGTSEVAVLPDEGSELLFRGRSARMEAPCVCEPLGQLMGTVRNAPPNMTVMAMYADEVGLLSGFHSATVEGDGTFVLRGVGSQVSRVRLTCGSRSVDRELSASGHYDW